MQKRTYTDEEHDGQITLMDWGNAIVRNKTLDSAGKVTAIEMDLHLEGDFRKTKKKITWLAAPTAQHALVDATLLDHDYLITKKLEENDTRRFLTAAQGLYHPTRKRLGLVEPPPKVTSEEWM